MKTISELQETARRQQQQIEAQQRQIAAKEERLHQLRQQVEQQAKDRQKLAQHRAQVEERERRLLQLRALRGEALNLKASNTSLLTELDTLKSIYAEKEKEFMIAIKRVNELKKELALVQDENSASQSSASVFKIETKKISQDLEHQNRLNDLQHSRLKTQQQLLQQKRDELTLLNNRTAMLQERLSHKAATPTRESLATDDAETTSFNLAVKSNVYVSNAATTTGIATIVKNSTINNTGLEAHNLREMPGAWTGNKEAMPSKLHLEEAAVTNSGILPVTNLDAEVTQSNKAAVSTTNHSEANSVNTKEIPPQQQTSSSDNTESSVNHSKYLLGSILPRPYGSTPGTSGLFSKPAGLQTNSTWSSLAPTMAQQATTTSNNRTEGSIVTTTHSSSNDKTPVKQLTIAANKCIPTADSDNDYQRQELAKSKVVKQEIIQSDTKNNVLLTSDVGREKLAVTQAKEMPPLELTSARSLYHESSPIRSEHMAAVEPREPLSSGGSPLLDTRHQEVTSPLIATGHHRTSSLPVTLPTSLDNVINSKPALPLQSSPLTTPRTKSLLAVIRSPPTQRAPCTSQSASAARELLVVPVTTASTGKATEETKVRNDVTTSRSATRSKEGASDAVAVLAHLKPEAVQTVSGGVPAAYSSVIRGHSPARQSPPSTVHSASSHEGDKQKRQLPLANNQDLPPQSIGAELQKSLPIISEGGSALPTTPGKQPADDATYTSQYSTAPSAQNAKAFDRQPIASLSTSQQPSAMPDVTSQLIPLKTSNLSGSLSNVASTRPPFRYASKSVIANTYMKKLTRPSGLPQQYSLPTMVNMPYSTIGPATFNDRAAAPGPVSSVSTEAWQTRNEASGVLRRQQGFDRPMDTSAAVDPYIMASGDDPSYPMISPALAAAVDGAMKYRRHSHSDYAYPAGAFVPPGFEGEKFSFRPYAPRSMRRRSFSSDDDVHGPVPAGLPNALPRPKHSEMATADEIPKSLEVTQEAVGRDAVVSEPREGEPDKVKSISMSSDETDGFQKSAQPTVKAGLLKRKESTGRKVSRRVSFDPLALLLDSALEGELDLLKKAISQVPDPSKPNDEGITALHNAICAGHMHIVSYLIDYGCNVNAPDTDGWTPLHCAASCNNLAILKLLVENGAALFAATISDQETASQKCEEEEEDFESCLHYLQEMEAALGSANGGQVFAVYDYQAEHQDELSFKDGDALVILRKGDEFENDWWWTRLGDCEGYVARNLLGLYPRKKLQTAEMEAE